MKLHLAHLLCDNKQDVPDDPPRAMELLYQAALNYPAQTREFMRAYEIVALPEYKSLFEDLFAALPEYEVVPVSENNASSNQRGASPIAQILSNKQAAVNKTSDVIKDRSKDGLFIVEQGGGYWLVGLDDGDPYKPRVRLRISYPDDAQAQLRGKIHAMDNVEQDLLDELMSPLDKLPGLGDIKQNVRDIVTLAFINKKRKEMGLKSRSPGLHMVFSGNPGTGKTHVARIVSQVLYQLGLVETGHLVEAHKADLVGEYIGWTEAKTSLVCQAALDGVLFIDEAYALSEDVGGYGNDAINTLMKIMEDHADRLIVVVAGYKEKMEQFIKTNPGLRSRFSQTIDFRDYTSEEMAEIFKVFAADYEYVLAEGTDSKVLAYLKNLKGNARDRFGNARGVRNLFDEILRRQSARLVREGVLDKETLVTIRPEDIPSDEILYDGPLAYLPNKKK